MTISLRKSSQIVAAMLKWGQKWGLLRFTISTRHQGYPIDITGEYQHYYYRLKWQVPEDFARYYLSGPPSETSPSSSLCSVSATLNIGCGLETDDNSIWIKLITKSLMRWCNWATKLSSSEHLQKQCLRQFQERGIHSYPRPTISPEIWITLEEMSIDVREEVEIAFPHLVIWASCHTEFDREQENSYVSLAAKVVAVNQWRGEELGSIFDLWEKVFGKTVQCRHVFYWSQDEKPPYENELEVITKGKRKIFGPPEFLPYGILVAGELTVKHGQPNHSLVLSRTIPLLTKRLMRVCGWLT